MKRIIVHLITYSLLLSICFAVILASADGYTDPFYIRFTTQKKSNLILGTSRAAQALQPNILKKELNKDFFNYAFTLLHSPFGETYLKSIKKKLDTTEKNAIFIVSVDPWSISSNTKNPDDPSLFREKKLILGTTSNVNIKPNFEYLLENFKGKYYTLLKPKNKNLFLHNDGWLEVSLQLDSIAKAKALKSKIKNYTEKNLPSFHFSKTRLSELEKTVSFLKNFGKVFLVRLPVHEQMFQIDQALINDFNEKIKPIIFLSDGYLDLTPLNSTFDYLDGNHLEKNSGAEVSLKVAKWIDKRLLKE